MTFLYGKCFKDTTEMEIKFLNWNFPNKRDSPMERKKWRNFAGKRPWPEKFIDASSYKKKRLFIVEEENITVIKKQLSK
jgi:hypothetical protein